MPKKKPLVLVVDDDSDILAYLFGLLESEGYLVATRTDGLEALKYVAANKPDVVVSDVRMPEIDGLELLEKVRHVSPGTRVILITAYADPATLRAARDRGAEVLIPKPFRNEEILRTVEFSLLEAP